MHPQQSVRMQNLFFFFFSCNGLYSKIILALTFISAFVKCLVLWLPIVMWNPLLAYTGKKV